MKVKELLLILSTKDPDAHIGVQCVEGDDWFILTDIAVETNGFGANAEIAIVRTDGKDPNFLAPGSNP